MKRALGLLSVLILVGCGTPTSSQNVADADQKPAAEADVADSPSDSGIELAIVDYQGVMEHVAENRGKVVVMDAWSTSCPPCLKEFHNLVELHNTYGPEKVACISLSFDYEGIDTPEDQAPRVLKFLERRIGRVVSQVRSGGGARRVRVRPAGKASQAVRQRTGQERRRGVHLRADQSLGRRTAGRASGRGKYPRRDERVVANRHVVARGGMRWGASVLSVVN